MHCIELRPQHIALKWVCCDAKLLQLGPCWRGAAGLRLNYRNCRGEVGPIDAE